MLLVLNIIQISPRRFTVFFFLPLPWQCPAEFNKIYCMLCIRQHNKEKRKFYFVHLRLCMMCLFSSSQAPSNDELLIRRAGSQCPKPPRSAHCLSRQKPVLGIVSKAGVKWSLAWIKSKHYCIHVNVFQCTTPGPVLTVASLHFTRDAFKRLWFTFKGLRGGAAEQPEDSAT